MSITSFTCVLLLLASSAPPAGSGKAALVIFLPRNVSVGSGTMRLGDVSIIRGADRKLTAKAEAIPLGRSPWPKERIVIDRRTVLGRLASSGIPGPKVQITGARAVTVTGKQSVIPAERIRRCAQAYLKANPPPPRPASNGGSSACPRT